MGDKVKDRKKLESGGGGSGKGRASGTAAKPKTETGAKANANGAKRLRPGELDRLVLSHMRGNEGDLPTGAGPIARAIGRSSGAVRNCLERLTKDKKVRQAKKSPRAYDFKGIN